MQMEQEMMSQGKMPTYEMTMAWLEACADRFAGCAMRSAEYRGWELLDKKSLHQASVDEVMESMENEEKERRLPKSQNIYHRKSRPDTPRHPRDAGAVVPKRLQNVQIHAIMHNIGRIGIGGTME